MNGKRKKDLTGLQPICQALKRRTEDNISSMFMEVKPVFPQKNNSGRNQKSFSRCGMTASPGTGSFLPKLRKGDEE